MLAARMEEHHEDPREFIQDPHTGRASMVRAMAQQVADGGGNQIPSGSVSFGDPQRLGGGAQPGGGRIASVWGSVGESLRGRDAELHRRIKSAAGVLQQLNPQGSGYEIGQRLFDYLAGTKQVSDPQLAAEIAVLRAEIPSVDAARFRSLPQLNEGAEAQVYHDEEGKVVYKLFKVRRRRGRRLCAQPNAIGPRWANSRRCWPASHLSGIPWAHGTHQRGRQSDSNGIRGGYSGRIFRFPAAFRYGAGRQREQRSLCSQFCRLEDDHADRRHCGCRAGRRQASAFR